MAKSSLTSMGVQFLAASFLAFPTALALSPNKDLFDRLDARNETTNWKIEAEDKVRRTNDKIPEQWRLAPEILQDAKKQQRLIGSNNHDMTIEDLILSLSSDDLAVGDSVSTADSPVSKRDVVEITSIDAVDLISSMKEGEYTAVEVVTSFCVRSAVIHQVHPVLLDIACIEAIEEARALDIYYKTTGELKGPLHGLPVTLKDQFHAANLETSGSFVAWFNATTELDPQPRTENKLAEIHATGFELNQKQADSDLVRKLKDRGAIPIAKTTIMQSTWSADTDNNLLGFLTNPYNTDLSSGGSSGGEGVLQALGGSAFGFGEDSGGSVAMPSTFQGLYSLKPSSGYNFRTRSDNVTELVPSPERWTMENTVNFGTRLETTEITCPGIMARSFETVDYVYRSVVTVDEEETPQGLIIAIMDNDGEYTPHPPIQRAMIRAKESLKRNQATLLQWPGTSASVVSDIHGTLARADDVIDIFHYQNATGEPFVPEISDLNPYLPEGPAPWNEKRQKMMDEAVALRDKYRQEYESIMEKHGIDALIMPVTASVAWKKGEADGGHSYASYANVLNVPTVTGRVTFASQSLDLKPPGNFTGNMGKSDRESMATYDPRAADGTPVSLMMLGRKEAEGHLLRVAGVILDDILATEAAAARDMEMSG